MATYATTIYAAINPNIARSDSSPALPAFPAPELGALAAVVVVAAAEEVLEGAPLVDLDVAELELALELDAELVVVLIVEVVIEVVGAAVTEALPVEAVVISPVPPATWKVGE